MSQFPFNVETNQVTPQPAKPNNDGKPGIKSSLKQNIFAAVERQAEQRKVANQSAYGTLAMLKVISNLMKVVIHRSEDAGTQAEMTQLSSKLLRRYAEQSSQIVEALGLPNEAWALESVTGCVSAILSEHYKVHGDKALELDLVPLLEEANKLEGVWQQKKMPDWGSPELKRTLSMMNALAPFMSAYQTFNYFHRDSGKTMEEVSQIIWDRVECTLDESPIIQNMGINEQEVLRQNLLLRAGQIMGESWQRHMREALAEIKEMAPEVRRQISLNGFPLDRVYSTFHQHYALLESALKSSLTLQNQMHQSPSGPQAG